MTKVHQDDDYIYPSLELSDDEMEVGSFMASAKDDAWTPKVKVSSYYLSGVQELGGQGGQFWYFSDDEMEVGSFMASAKDDTWTPKVKVSMNILAGVQELGRQLLLHFLS